MNKRKKIIILSVLSIIGITVCITIRVYCDKQSKEYNYTNYVDYEENSDTEEENSDTEEENMKNNKDSTEDITEIINNYQYNTDELNEIFNEGYYIDDEDIAREIIRIQGDALRKTASDNEEIREIEKRLEDTYEIEAVNLQDLDLEMAQYIEEACKYMYNRYPSLKGFLTNIAVQEDISVTDGIIAKYETQTFIEPPEEYDLYPFCIKRQILLNAEDFYKPQRMKNMIKRSIMEGHWRENTTITSIFIHELTHCLLDSIVYKNNGLDKVVCITEEKGDAFTECVTQDLAINQTLEKDICNTAYKNYLLENEECTYEEFCLQISGYAVGLQEDGGISYGETIAEAMTDIYINGDNCTSASKAIINEMEARLKSQ